MFCPECGKELMEARKFCIHCGTSLQSEPKEAAQPQVAIRKEVKTAEMPQEQKQATVKKPLVNQAPADKATPAKPEDKPKEKASIGEKIIIAIIVFAIASLLGRCMADSFVESSEKGSSGCVIATEIY